MICRRKDSKLSKGKVNINQMFVADSDVISAPKKCNSSSFKVDATSHESLQLKQFSNDIVWRLMQYSIFSILL